MSDLEEDQTPIPTTLNVALFRIALGIAFGSIVIGILFTVWSLTTYGSGPVIGILIFQFISVGAVMYLGVHVILNRIKVSDTL